MAAKGEEIHLNANVKSSEDVCALAGKVRLN